MIYDFRFMIYDLMITTKHNSVTKSKKPRASGIFRIKITKDLAMRLQQHPKSATVWMRWIKFCVSFLRKIHVALDLLRPFWAMQKGQNRRCK
jgi:hypothetical protein